MTASRLFQTIVRAFIIIFVISAIWSAILSKPLIDGEKVSKLKIPKDVGPSFDKWGNKDFEIAEALIKEANKALINNSNETAKVYIQKARYILADEFNSTSGAKILKIQNAIETLPKLIKAMQSTQKNEFKLVKVIPRKNSSYIGHIIDEDNISYSIQDEGGFLKPELKKNILSIEEITGKDKANFYEQKLKEVIEENGTKSTFGLFTSAKWAYEHNLLENSRELLFKITEKDPNPMETIFQSEAKNLLVVGRWSNAVGDFDIAKEKANQIINQFPNTDFEIQAKALLVDVEKNLIAMQDIPKSETTTAIATVKLAVNKEEIKLDEEKPPEVIEKQPIIAEPTPAETPKISTLKLKKSTAGDTNKELEDVEEQVQKVRDNPRRPQGPKNDFQSEPKFIEALACITKGKELTNAGHSFGYIGNKNAQIKFKEALTQFDKAISILNGLQIKYGADSEFGDYAEQANGLRFYINKNCIHH